MERRKIYGGDKSIMYEKMGLVDETDIEKYRKKLGLKKGVDLIGLDIEDIEQLLAEKAMETAGVKGVRNTRFKKKMQDFNTEELKKILIEFKEEQKTKESLDPLARERYE